MGVLLTAILSHAGLNEDINIVLQEEKVTKVLNRRFLAFKNEIVPFYIVEIKLKTQEDLVNIFAATYPHKLFDDNSSFETTYFLPYDDLVISEKLESRSLVLRFQDGGERTRVSIKNGQLGISCDIDFGGPFQGAPALSLTPELKAILSGTAVDQAHFLFPSFKCYDKSVEIEMSLSKQSGSLFSSLDYALSLSGYLSQSNATLQSLKSKATSTSVIGSIEVWSFAPESTTVTIPRELDGQNIKCNYVVSFVREFEISNSPHFIAAAAGTAKIAEGTTPKLIGCLP